MGLRMGDGPIRNLPAGLDAYAGYVDNSGIGETWTAIRRIPAEFHLSISTIPGVWAMTGDVEKGALSDWTGYDVGYAAASEIGDLILRFGRPKKLWSAHHNDIPHVCTSQLCWPTSKVPWIADGTQWTNHQGAWDESQLADNFFDFLNPPTAEDDVAYLIHAKNPSGQDYDAVTDGVTAHRVHEGPSLAAWQARLGAPVELTWDDYQSYPGAI